jgi:hypothetical protein
MPLTPKDRRTLIIGGTVLGVILVGFLVFNLLSGGGTGALPPFSGGIHSRTGSPSSSSTSQPNPPPAAAGRDPFSIPPGMGGTVAPTSGSTSPPPTGGQSQGPPPTLPGNGSAFRIGGHTVVLVSVYAVSGVGHAQVEVDGVIYNPAVGAHFAGGQFQLRSTNGTCANFLYGDQAFTLCTNPLK